MSIAKLRAIFSEIEERVIKTKLLYQGCDGCLYRGQPKWYDKVSSTLYRKHEFAIEHNQRKIRDIESEVLKKAKKYTDETDEFEIFTALQHFGGRTNLIDFTTDYCIAVFFACDSYYDEDGWIVILPKVEVIQKQMKRPVNPRNRVEAQKSVFVRPIDTGYIPLEMCELVRIPRVLKNSMLDYLNDYHGISTTTIYSDLHGFIRNELIHEKAEEEFAKGLSDYISVLSASLENIPLEKQKVLEESEQHFTEALRMKMSPHIYQQRGDVRHLKGETGLAIADYDKAIEQDPSNAEFYHKRGDAYYAKDDLSSAIDDYETAINLKHDYASAYANRGDAYGDMDEFGLAIKDYDKAIELEPNNAFYYSKRGSARSTKGKFDLAIIDYSKAIELEPNNVFYYKSRALTYQQKNEFGPAIVDCSKVIELDSDDADAYLNRADLYSGMDEQDLASKDYNKVITLKPTDAVGYSARGRAYRAKEELDLAIADYNQAIDLVVCHN